jgi:hypothetical protein
MWLSMRYSIGADLALGSGHLLDDGETFEVDKGVLRVGPALV